MELGTTPFGGRPMTLALLQARNGTREVPDGASADKWQLYRWLCEGKT
ncbi:MAG: replication initiation protein RepC, partial [Mesorhizobium sp.]